LFSKRYFGAPGGGGPPGGSGGGPRGARRGFFSVDRVDLRKIAKKKPPGGGLSLSKLGKWAGPLPQAGQPGGGGRQRQKPRPLFRDKKKKKPRQGAFGGWGFRSPWGFSLRGGAGGLGPRGRGAPAFGAFLGAGAGDFLVPHWDFWGKSFWRGFGRGGPDGGGWGGFFFPPGGKRLRFGNFFTGGRGEKLGGTPMAMCGNSGDLGAARPGGHVGL